MSKNKNMIHKYEAKHTVAMLRQRRPRQRPSTSKWSHRFSSRWYRFFCISFSSFRDDTIHMPRMLHVCATDWTCVSAMRWMRAGIGEGSECMRGEADERCGIIFTYTIFFFRLVLFASSHFVAQRFSVVFSACCCRRCCKSHEPNI